MRILAFSGGFSSAEVRRLLSHFMSRKDADRVQEFQALHPYVETSASVRNLV